MQAIFNSLGSNYNRQFINLSLQQLFASPKQSAENQLTSVLSLLFDGDAFLFRKGRDSLEFILKTANIGKGDSVLTQAFTCYAIEQAIKRTGANTAYTDIAQGTINLSVETLDKAFKKNPKAKAVIVQYSLGTVADIVKIKKFCKKNNLLLIEDLAQGFGGKDNKGVPLGTHGDAVLLSFGRDKIIDAVSGGAAIIKKDKLKAQQQYSELEKNEPLSNSKKDRSKILLYPCLSSTIRSTYNMGFGKLIHYLLKKIGFFYSPLKSSFQTMQTMPGYLIPLVLYQYQILEKQLKHRRSIASTYYQELKKIKEIKLVTTNFDIEHGSNLRFAFTTSNPKKLLNTLSSNDIHLTDRWYRRAVDCSTIKCNSSYIANSCPNAELIASKIINLPTHQQINQDKALKISKVISMLYGAK